MHSDVYADGLVAETDSGRVRGLHVDGVHAFLGVPYAASTSGRSRFQPPRPHPGWAGVRDARSYGPTSPQRPLTEALGARPAVVSLLPLFGIPTKVVNQGEDCLVLNIWTPGARPAARRPVLVWLHGGTDFGAGDWPRFDGAALARQGDLLVVTVNHRLGIFGHLDLSWTGLPEYAASGQVGLLDLRTALNWLQHNVESFGGDPANLTLAGCSRGASRVAALLSVTSPEPPFQRAILTSPPPPRPAAAVSPQDAARTTLQHLGIPPDRSDLLAQVPVDRLLGAQALLRAEYRHAFQPTVDGSPVEKPCYTDLAGGAAPHVPVMIGSALNETARTIEADPAYWEGLDDAELARRCSMIARCDVTDLVAEYRRERPQTPARRIAVVVTTDALYRFPALALASARSATATAPTYSYVFAGGTGSHGEDALFFFDNLRHAALVARNPANAALARAASAAWITFCHTGSPEVPGVGSWPAYTDAQRHTLLFGNPTRAVNDPFATRRAAWTRTCPPPWLSRDVSEAGGCSSTAETGA
ncbi:carboxylesterase/lipase family protein [Streptomyces sp. NPDC052236]|uniref:carboxylesterase/lipase family protein n=1 Tax=Streptomyces sp. NPDC052236 TaxID=3365686 RepID=UPI0037CED8EA